MRARQVLAGVVVGFVLASGIAVAADVVLPHVFVPNTPARAAEVNANFGALKAAVDAMKAQAAGVEARIGALESGGGTPVYANPTTGKTYSVGGSYCGPSAPISGAQGGWSGAKQICETSCGSPTAHVCTSDEIVRFLSTGGALPAEYGWIQSAESSEACSGWTSSSSISSTGSAWYVGFGGSYLRSARCNESIPIYCCD